MLDTIRLVGTRRGTKRITILFLLGLLFSCGESSATSSGSSGTLPTMASTLTADETTTTVVIPGSNAAEVENPNEGSSSSNHDNDNDNDNNNKSTNDDDAQAKKSSDSPAKRQKRPEEAFLGRHKR
mmetsp:Transcript_11760/g.24862  ORF Transcript_11760/g.24862 Transcript_11760/m.24862 type:complete len:126 (+) Transcript_11760:134-511(+)